MRETVIVSAVRTPIGRRNGVLSGVHPNNLGAVVLNEVVKRAVLHVQAMGPLYGRIDLQSGRYFLINLHDPPILEGKDVVGICKRGLEQARRERQELVSEMRVNGCSRINGAEQGRGCFFSDVFRPFPPLAQRIRSEDGVELAVPVEARPERDAAASARRLIILLDNIDGCLPFHKLRTRGSCLALRNLRRGQVTRCVRYALELHQPSLRAQAERPRCFSQLPGERFA